MLKTYEGNSLTQSTKTKVDFLMSHQEVIQEIQQILRT